MSDAEFGDKIVLPPSVLLKVETFRIPFPLFFTLRHSRSTKRTAQHVGILEFSAPEDKAYIPYWIMENLELSEGDRLQINSALNIPKGIYCRFEPACTTFLDVAASIGPKTIMENAMRRYSVLCSGESIMIEHEGKKHFLRIVEVKPAGAISILGNVDLSVDFSCNTKIATQGNKVPMNRDLSSKYNIEKDGSGTLEARVTTISQSATKMEQVKGNNSKLNLRATPTLGVNTLIEHCQYVQAFATPGHILSPKNNENEPMSNSAMPVINRDQPPENSEHKECSHCLAFVPNANYTLHFTRCSKNTAYHKKICSICSEKIFKSLWDTHCHCQQCDYIGSTEEVEVHAAEAHRMVHCTCGEVISNCRLQRHVEDSCPNFLVQCTICKLEFKRSAYNHHYSICSCRTDFCDICKKYVPIIGYEDHVQSCCDIPPEISKNQTQSIGQHACLYCDKTFQSQAAAASHVRENCAIARSFKPQMANVKPVVGKFRVSHRKSIKEMEAKKKKAIAPRTTENNRQDFMCEGASAQRKF